MSQVQRYVGRRATANWDILAIVESACLVFLALGAGFVGMFPAGKIPQAFLVFSLSISLCGLLAKLLMRKAIRPDLLLFCGTSTVLCLVYVVTAAFAGQGVDSVSDMEFLKLALRLMVGPAVFLFCASANWEKKLTVWSVCILGASWLLTLTFIQGKNGFSTGNVIGELHSNRLGFMGFMGVVLGLEYIHRTKGWFPGCIIFPIGLVSVFASKSRGSLVALMIFLVIALGGKVLRVGNKTVIVSFFCLIAVLIIVSFRFPDLMDSQLATSLDSASRQLTGKPLDTGRGKYWRNAIDQIDSKNLLWGSGVNAREQWDRKLPNGKRIRLSVHSYYLAVIGECGVIGLLCIVALVAHVLFIGLNQPSLHLMGSVFAVMVFEASEVSLTTGTFTVGIAIWAMWGLTVSSKTFHSN